MWGQPDFQATKIPTHRHKLRSGNGFLKICAGYFGKIMERPIPEFRHRDKVRISTEYSGPQAGKTGVIFGSANVVPMTSFEPVADGQDITGEQVTYM